MQNQKGYELAPRDREILKDVIRTFILDGDPVSSRAVAKHAQHGLSAASIRNSMADLEELGYLRQPHTSSGRVPTDAGYRLYVDSLMTTRKVPASQKRYIREHLDKAGGAEEMTSVTSQLLSDLTQQIGVVLTPAVKKTVLQAVHFTPLSGNCVLCVLVSESGFVDHKLVRTEKPFRREDLERISNLVNDRFVGRSVEDVRDDVVRSMAEDRVLMDRLLADAIALVHPAINDTQDPEVMVQGASNVLALPELGDVETVRTLLDKFADQAQLVGLLNDCMVGVGVRVCIGDDSELTSELDFSLVATTYGTKERAFGTLGILGPSRMEYQRVIPLVDYLGETLSRALEGTLGEIGEVGI